MATLGMDMHSARTRWTALVLITLGLLASACGSGDGGGSPAGSGDPDVGAAADDLGRSDLGPLSSDVGSVDTGDPSSDTDTSDDVGRDPADLGPDPADAGPDPADAGPASCAVRGRVMAPDGPVDQLSLVLCDDSFCNRARSEPSGVFEFADAPNVPLALKVLGDSLGLSSMTLPELRCPGAVLELGDLRVWPLATGTVVAAATGGEVQVHPDLSLSLSAGLKYPNFEDEAEVSALRLEPADLHPDLLQRLAPHFVFVFAPYGTECSAPAGFALRSGLDAGAAVRVAAVDHGSGALIDLFTATVEAEGWVRSPEGQGLPELSWLILMPAQ